MASTSEVIVRLPGGRRVDAQIGRHTIHTDQPISNGGQDAAPSPFDVFLASMGACSGIFVQGFCAKRGIPYEDIRIVERPEYDADGTLHAVDFDIELPPEFPEKYREALVRAVEQCSVKRAIQAKPTFRVHTVPSEQTRVQAAVGDIDARPADR
jgi:putative redox protein